MSETEVQTETVQHHTPSALSDTVILETAEKKLRVWKRRRKTRRFTAVAVLALVCCCFVLFPFQKKRTAESVTDAESENDMVLSDCPAMKTLRSSLNDLESDVSSIAEDDRNLRDFATAVYPITFAYVSYEESL